MSAVKIYLEDLQIARSIIGKDGLVTRQYLYQQCYPLFKSIYDNYYTDCMSCKEFIDEIYLVILTPSKTTGKCQLENFKGESTLTSWLKSVCLFYCYDRFEKKGRMPKYEPLQNLDGEDAMSDRLEAIYGTIDLDLTNINREDVLVVLGQMPNERYRELIRLRYLEQKTNEETAIELGMTMENFYNKHKLAKEQYERVAGKEEHHV